jgi:hypothetical protein
MFLRQVLRATSHTRGDFKSVEELVSTIGTRLARTICGLRGHSDLLHLTSYRVSLRCLLCGHETPGWDLGSRQPSLTDRALTPSVRVEAQQGMLTLTANIDSSVIR